ncbi:glycosyltransferase [Algoriphagus sp.]|uniref:glycosyltransferase n=1 Tax=Algoriphagus sp. TaxID=1872435 RepID=UPI00351EB154
MISFYLLWTGCYFVLLCLLGMRWPKKQSSDDSDNFFPKVTLLIPFRNELENLGNLAEELSKLTYPDLRILLVDDQSEDGSFLLFKEKFETDSRIHVIQSTGIGKKRALEIGVQAAEGDLILCSDADCRYPNNWVERMVGPFMDPEIQLVAGPVISAGQHNFFQRFQQIEWSSILLLTQFFFSHKRPLMCSGANLAYRRQAFQSVNAYGQNLQYLSGDDEFLLKKIAARYGKESCMYLPFIGSLVCTQPQKSLSNLLNQRIRWAGKWKAHRSFVHAFSALLSFLTQLTWLLSLLLLGLGKVGFMVFLLVWIGKILSERMALGMVLNTLSLRFSFVDFVKTAIAHPFYVILVAFGAIWGKFTWKGRAN